MLFVSCFLVLAGSVISAAVVLFEFVRADAIDDILGYDSPYGAVWSMVFAATSLPLFSLSVMLMVGRVNWHPLDRASFVASLTSLVLSICTVYHVYDCAIWKVSITQNASSEVSTEDPGVENTRRYWKALTGYDEELIDFANDALRDNDSYERRRLDDVAASIRSIPIAHVDRRLVRVGRSYEAVVMQLQKIMVQAEKHGTSWHKSKDKAEKSRHEYIYDEIDYSSVSRFNDQGEDVYKAVSAR